MVGFYQWRPSHSFRSLSYKEGILMSFFSAFMVGMALFAVGVFIVKFTDWFFIVLVQKPGALLPGFFASCGWAVGGDAGREKRAEASCTAGENGAEKSPHARAGRVCAHKKVGRKGRKGAFKAPFLWPGEKFFTKATCWFNDLIWKINDSFMIC